MSDEVGSFEHVFRQHHGFVWRSLARHGVRPADLCDACQDVFLVVHRRLPEFEGRAALRTWLYRIARRVAADYRKRAHRRREQPTGEIPIAVRDFAACAAPPTAPDAQLEAEQLARALETALEGLSAPKRAAFVLHEIEQWPMEQVADALACPLKTAYSRLHAARDGMRAALRRAGVAGAIVAAAASREAAAQEIAALNAVALARLAAWGPAPAQTAKVWSALKIAVPAGLGLASLGASTSVGTAVLIGALLLCGANVAPLSTPAGAMLTRVDARIQHEPRRTLLPALLATARAPVKASVLSPARQRSARPAPLVQPPPHEPAGPVAEPPVASAWLEPSTEPVPMRTTAAPRAVDLDEVLAVTDPRPLMRVRGAGAILVPAARNRAARSRITAPDRHP